MKIQSPSEKTPRPTPVALAVKHPFIRIFLLALVLTHMVLPQSHAETEAKCRFARVGILPIVINRSRPLIMAEINGQPIKMGIDTGASFTSLFLHAATKLDLPMGYRHGLVYGVGGDSEQYRATIKEFSLGPDKVKSLGLPVIREYAEGITEDGLIGSDFLLHRDVEISMADQKITFFNPVNCQDTFLGYWDDNAFIVDLKAPKDGLQQQRPILDVELNGKKVRAIIDTGATRSVVSLEAAARAGITPQSSNVVKRGKKMSGIGNAALENWVATFDSFSIGDELIQNSQIVIGDLWAGIRHDVKKNYVNELINEMPEMLLGMDFIRSHRLLFSVSQRRLYFSYLGGQVFYTEPPQEADVNGKNGEIGNAKKSENAEK